ncbi:MAG: SDR family oxidoreductase, partial [Candidatus Hydrogenedentes bacterium]|nr:SDR family oxidoreductase [Candidatus Hydrogenedentota bacterium]
AGITRDGLLMRMKNEDWDAVMDTNLNGVFYLCRAVSRDMLKQRAGRIINISSIIGLRGQAGQANSAAAKAGLLGFTKSLARELGSRGVTANVVCPGYIETDMTAVIGEDLRKELLSRIPLNRVGQAEDIAGVVRFLASDAAAYITGAMIRVDGGLAM